ncbi:MAG TPA: hypothetical protein VF027_02545 [Sphingomicrobium sp.]
MYRDAGNFKAFGTVALIGALSQSDRRVVQGRLDSGEFFIAEQIGVPPLYDELYRWSDGPTPSDHCWHEFVGLRDVTSPPDKHVPQLEVEAFVERFGHIAEWDCSLSPHFELGFSSKQFPVLQPTG